jgi:protein HOOK3
VKTFPLESKVESFADLSDGFVLSKMLGTCSSGALFTLILLCLRMLTSNSAEDFDPAFAINDLEKNASPSKWINKKKSLEAVYKSLLRFTSRHCTGLETPTLDTNIDLNSIAEHDDAQQMIKVGAHFKG